MGFHNDTTAEHILKSFTTVTVLCVTMTITVINADKTHTIYDMLPFVLIFSCFLTQLWFSLAAPTYHMYIYNWPHSPVFWMTH